MLKTIDPNDKYLQLAFNHSWSDFKRLIAMVPRNEHIIVEAGTPFLKRYGVGVLRQMRRYWPGKLLADLKVVDGAEDEVRMTANAGADLITALGSAGKESLNIFVETCQKYDLVPVFDMLHVKRPMKTLWKAEVIPEIVTLHLGRDEENSYGKVIQYKEIAKIKGKWEVMAGAAGGIDHKEMSSALFNGADVVVVNAVKPSDPWTGLVINDQFGNKVKGLLNLLS